MKKKIKRSGLRGLGPCDHLVTQRFELRQTQGTNVTAQMRDFGVLYDPTVDSAYNRTENKIRQLSRDIDSCTATHQPELWAKLQKAKRRTAKKPAKRKRSR